MANIIVTTKKDLADRAAEAAGITKKEAAAAVNAVFDALAETLKDAGEKIEIAASKSPKFKPAKALKDAVK